MYININALHYYSQSILPECARLQITSHTVLHTFLNSRLQHWNGAVTLQTSRVTQVSILQQCQQVSTPQLLHDEQRRCEHSVLFSKHTSTWPRDWYVTGYWRQLTPAGEIYCDRFLLCERFNPQNISLQWYRIDSVLHQTRAISLGLLNEYPKTSSRYRKKISYLEITTFMSLALLLRNL